MTPQCASAFGGYLAAYLFIYISIRAPAGAELHQLSTLSRLQHLNLRGVYRLADTNLAVSGLTALQSLNLQECWQITAQGLMNLSTLVQLTHLNLQVTLFLPLDYDDDYYYW